MCGIFKALEEESQGKADIETNLPEWDEWKQYGNEWVRAQWPQAKTR